MLAVAVAAAEAILFLIMLETVLEAPDCVGAGFSGVWSLSGFNTVVSIVPCCVVGTTVLP